MNDPLVGIGAATTAFGAAAMKHEALVSYWRAVLGNDGFERAVHYAETSDVSFEDCAQWVLAHPKLVIP